MGRRRQSPDTTPQQARNPFRSWRLTCTLMLTRMTARAGGFAAVAERSWGPMDADRPATTAFRLYDVRPHNQRMDLSEIVTDVATALVSIDSSGVPFKQFQAGVGPYGEPQLTRAIVERLSVLPAYRGKVTTRRIPDVLIKGLWALEFKLARPFGDNGKQAENWSVNLLHPYPGNVSAISDCLKLEQWEGPERRAVVVIGYEHTPPQIDLEPLFASFEVVASNVLGLKLGRRVQETRPGLAHPVHQQLKVAAWEVLPRAV